MEINNHSVRYRDVGLGNNSLLSYTDDLINISVVQMNDSEKAVSHIEQCGLMHVKQWNTDLYFKHHFDYFMCNSAHICHIMTNINLRNYVNMMILKTLHRPTEMCLLLPHKTKQIHSMALCKQ